MLRATEIRNSYVCPITQLIMYDPVVTEDGHTYEREEIERWLLCRSTSPNTNLPINKNILIPNNSIRSDIAEFLMQNPDLYNQGRVYFSQSLQKDCIKAIKENNTNLFEKLITKDKRCLTEALVGEYTAFHLALEFANLNFVKMLGKKLSQHAILAEALKKPVPNGFNCSPVNVALLAQYKQDVACIRTLCGHTDVVTCVLKLTDGRLASASWDTTIKLWDIGSSECLGTLRGHTRNVTCLQELATGELVSGSTDGHLRVWDINNGVCRKVIAAHIKSVRCIQKLTNGNLATSSSDGTIKIWDLNQQICLKTLSGHTDGVDCLLELKNGNLLSGSWDKSIKIWDTKTGTCRANLRGHTKTVKCLLELDNGDLVTGSMDKCIKFWNLDARECHKTLVGHADSVTCLAQLKSGELISGSWDKSIKIWNLQGQNIDTVNMHTGVVNCLLELENQTILSCSDDKTIQLWNISGFLLPFAPREPQLGGSLPLNYLKLFFKG